MPKLACMTSVAPIGFGRMDLDNRTKVSVRRLRELAQAAKTATGVEADEVSDAIFEAYRIEANHELAHSFNIPIPFIGPQPFGAVVRAYLQQIKAKGGSMGAFL